MLAGTSYSTSTTVGTPGLGYPLLLCLGKGLVVILNYIQTAGPLRSGVLFSQLRSGPVPRLGKVRRHHVSRKRQELVREQPGLRTSQGDRTPCIVTGPLTKGRNRHPASGWSGDATCLQDMAVWVSILTYTHRIHCGRWTFALI